MSYRGFIVLRRIVFSSRSIGAGGLSTVSLAHILGAAERNNRRDQITGGMVLHGDRILHAMEGPALEIGRAMARIHADPRHTEVQVLVDQTVAVRALAEPMRLCDDPEAFLAGLNVRTLDEVTAEAAQAELDRRLAA